MPGEHQHRSAKAQGGRAGPDPGEQIQGRRHLAKTGEMVLNQERAVVAECLGLNIALGDHGVSEVQALVMTCRHSSKRASASSMEMQNPANSL